MAYIILPSRRTRQPQVVASSRFRGLFFNPATTTETLTRVATAQGIAASLVDNSLQAVTLPISVNGFQNLTLAALVYVDSLNPEVPRGLIGTRTTTDAPGYAQIVQRSDNQWAGQVKIDAADANQYTNVGGAVTVGWNFVALTIGADCRLYLNNNEPVVFTRSSTNVLSGHPALKIGYYYDGIADGRWRFVGKVPGAYVVPDALTSGDIAALANNFWSGIVSARRLYFGASGGGANIFESTFATSWSLSEAYSTSATLVSTYADSPTVTDSSSSSAVFSSAFAETIPVSDGPSADMGGVANRTQEESFTITDAYSASMVANATISETLSAEASASAAAIFNATFAETLPIVDGEEADAGRISDIAENVSVTDAYTAGIVAQATQAESVTTIDTYDTIAIYNPLLAETLPITDAVGATLTVPTSGTVDLSQESIDSLAHEIMVQLTSTPVRKL